MSQIILIVGKKGSGKSRLANLLVKAGKQFTIIFDRAVKANKGSDYNYTEKFSDFPEFADWFLDQATANGQPAHSILSLQFKREMDWKYAFKLLAEEENFTLVIEEASFYMSPNWIDPGLEAILRQARNNGVSVILISHRPVDFNGLVISFADTVIGFHDTAEANLARLKLITFVGDKALELKELKLLGTDPATGNPYSEYKIYGDQVRI